MAKAISLASIKNVDTAVNSVLYLFQRSCKKSNTEYFLWSLESKILGNSYILAP